MQLGSRALAAIGSVLLFFLAFWLVHTWHDVRARQVRRMSVAAGLIAGESSQYFDLLGLYAQDLGAALERGRALDRPGRTQAILRDFLAARPVLADVAVLDARGRVRAAGAAVAPGEWARLSPGAERPSAGSLRIEPPRYSPALHAWFLPVWRALAAGAGRGRAWIGLAVPLELQQRPWRGLDLLPGATISLVREDGCRISLFPSSPSPRPYVSPCARGAPVPGGHAGVRAGSYERRSPGGAVHIGAYRRLAHYPLYAAISVPLADVAGIFWRYVRLPVFFMFCGLLAGTAFYGVLARRFVRRMQVIGRRLGEASLAPLGELPSSGVREIDALCLRLAETRRALAEGARSRERLLLHAAQAGTYAVRRRDGVVVEADADFLRMLGQPPEAVIGRPWLNLVMPADRAAAAARPGESHTVRFNRADGQPLWLSIAEYEEAWHGEDVRVGLAIDVSRREQLLAQIRSQSTRLQTLWRVVAERMLSDNRRISLTLAFGMKTLGMETALVGEFRGEQYLVHHAIDATGTFAAGQEMPVRDTLCQLVARDGRNLFIANLSADERFRAYPSVQRMGVNTYVSAGVWLEDRLYGTLVFLRREPNAEGFSDDDKVFIELLASWLGQVLLQQRHRAELENLAMTDSLTGLPNRRGAERRLAEELREARENNGRLSIAICDIDYFKLVNDHFGHDVGDGVLRQMSEVIRGALRAGDWAARWGGEEFLIVFRNAERADAAVGAERVREAIRSGVVVSPQNALDVTASLGVATFSDPAQSIDHALAEADDCLYEAKKRGRNCVVVAGVGPGGMPRRSQMLKNALLDHRIEPAYQEIVDLRSGATVAEEALARLVLEDGEVLSTQEFIEAAEAFGLIQQIDNMMVRRVLARCAARRAADVPAPARLHFVNLSPQFLARRDLVEALMGKAAELASCGREGLGSPGSVVFEITERQLIADIDRLNADLRPFLDMGFRLALDDFGSGYSSFLYLANLPVSFIKIEGRLVQGMRSIPHAARMVENIVTLARSLGITTIAEHIEDQDIAARVRAAGVDWGQGYYYGRPESGPGPL